MFSSPAHKRQNLPWKSHGFALVTALSLMAFVLLLSLTLTTFVRIKTQSSESQIETLKARQTALLALHVAIGELQQYAGADRRVTGTAELLDSSQVIHNPKWTGVWKNNNAASSVPVTTIYQPQLLNWLVSGNEGVVFPVGEADAEPEFTPKAADFARKTNQLEPGPEARGVTLVGGGSVGLSLSDTDNNIIEDDDGVMAPLVGITGRNGSTEGRYAFWVGDEGVKARVNLRDPLAGAAPASADGRRRLSMPARAAPEIFSQAPSGSLDPDLWGSAFPVNAQSLERTVFKDSLKSLLKTTPNEADAWLKTRFHDLSLWSQGLLVDSKSGGLKKDLTAAMRLSASQWSAFKNEMGAGSPAPELIFPPLDGGATPDDPGGPHWDLLRSFVRDAATLSTALPPRPQTPDSHGFSPIVQQFKLFIGPSILEGTDAEGKRTRSLRLHYMPVLTLWNPYDRPIAATDYYLTFAPLNADIDVHVGLEPTHWAEPGGTGSPDAVFEADFRISPQKGPPNLVFDRAFRFKIDSPEIPPGAAIVFSPPDGGSLLQFSSSPPNSDGDFNLLVAGFRDGANYHFDMAGPTSGTIEEDDEIHHISVSGGNGTQTDLRLGLDPVGVRETPLLVVHNMVFWRLHSAGADGFQHEDPDLWPRVTVSNTGGFASGQFTDSAGNYLTTGATEPIVGYWLVFRMSKGVSRNIDHLPHPWAKAYNPRGPIYGQSLIEFPVNTPRGFDRPPSYINDLISNDVSSFYSVDNLNGAFTFPGFTTESLVGERAVLYQAFGELEDFTSIGDLMHANLVPDSGNQADNLAYMNIMANYPNYAVGSSIQSPYLDTTSSSPYRSTWPSGVDNPFHGGEDLVFYDLPYLLNEALWDRLFFSSFDDAKGAFRNSRFVPLAPGQGAPPTPGDIEAVSGNFAVAGAFNVNSTSVEARAAVLGAFLGIEASGVSVAAHEALLTRVAFPVGEAFKEGQLADEDSAWTGIRRMTNTEIRALAEAVVAEVKARGPFLSLAHFINRDIDAVSDTDLRQRGALDAAIAASGVNASLAEDADGSPMQIEQSVWENRPPRIRFDNYNIDALTDPVTDQIPGAVSQPGLLAKLGSVLSPRSDTFTIRFYGDSIDPIDGAQVARAWGEAVVQRQVEPVEPSTARPSEPSADTADTFGRRFTLVAFRWLQPEEI